MSDTIAVANVATRFVVDPSVSGLSSISRQIANISGQITGMGRLFSIVAGGAGLERLVGSVIKLNSSLQDATFGMATLFSAIDHRKFTNAMSLARTEIQGLREDAAKGAGGLKDYLDSYQRIFAPARQAGGSLNQIRELNRLVVAAGFARGMGPQGASQAASSVARAVGGNVSLRNAPVVAEALASIGVNLAQFRAESPEQRLQTLIKAFGSFKEAADAMGKTWSSRIETFTNSIQNFALEVSGGLFDQWNDDLGQINDWLGKNRVILDDIAGRIGSRLLSVFQQLSQDPGGTLAAAVGVGAGLTAGGAAARAASGLKLSAPMMAPAGAVWNASAGRYQLSSGKFAAPVPLGGGGVVSAGIGGLATFGWVAAIAAAVAAVAAFVSGSVAAAAARFPNLVARIGASFGQLALEAANLWKSFSNFIMHNPIMLGLGKALLIAADGIVMAAGKTMRILSIFIDFFTDMISIVSGPVLSAVDSARQGHFTEAKAFMDTAGVLVDAASLRAAGGFKNLMRDSAIIVAPGTNAPSGGKSDEDRDKPGNITNINGPITVKVVAEKLDDPNSVASTFEAILEKIRQFPTVSGSARLVPRPG